MYAVSAYGGKESSGTSSRPHHDAVLRQAPRAPAGNIDRRPISWRLVRDRPLKECGHVGGTTRKPETKRSSSTWGSSRESAASSKTPKKRSPGSASARSRPGSVDAIGPVCLDVADPVSGRQHLRPDEQRRHHIGPAARRLRGVGGNPPLAAVRGLPKLPRQLARALAVVDVDGPAVVVGHRRLEHARLGDQADREPMLDSGRRSYAGKAQLIRPIWATPTKEDHMILFCNGLGSP